MVTSATRCSVCQLTGHNIVESDYFRVNGSNEIVCLPHAVEMELRFPEYTFEGVSASVAEQLTAN